MISSFFFIKKKKVSTKDLISPYRYFFLLAIEFDATFPFLNRVYSNSCCVCEA